METIFKYAQSLVYTLLELMPSPHQHSSHGSVARTILTSSRTSRACPLHQQIYECQDPLSQSISLVNTGDDSSHATGDELQQILRHLPATFAKLFSSECWQISMLSSPARVGRAGIQGRRPGCNGCPSTSGTGRRLQGGTDQLWVYRQRSSVHGRGCRSDGVTSNTEMEVKTEYVETLAT